MWGLCVYICIYIYKYKKIKSVQYTIHKALNPSASAFFP